MPIERKKTPEVVALRLNLVGADVALKPRRPEVLHDEKRQRSPHQAAAHFKLSVPFAASVETGALRAHDGLEVRLQACQVQGGPLGGHDLIGSADGEPHRDRRSLRPCVKRVLHRLPNEALRKVGAEELTLNRVLIRLRWSHGAKAPARQFWLICHQ
ncbi:hypothetical protein [Candidatus Palauibacter sp.]|uniref:hypothetical protein n=1 Tax=Candidatus Palauibacter sp. TaxID=3101350 RepID=UPI003AF2DD65